MQTLKNRFSFENMQKRMLSLLKNDCKNVMLFCAYYYELGKYWTKGFLSFSSKSRENLKQSKKLLAITKYERFYCFVTFLPKENFGCINSNLKKGSHRYKVI